MATESLNDLFYDTLRDVYWAEKHLVKALPKLAGKTTNPDLIDALKRHHAETEEHVDRLERVFASIDKAARGKKCEAMVGLSAEADHAVEETDKNAVRDAGIIAAAQAVEHYEIARYGTLAAWAELLGLDEAAKLLNETLEEEKAADERLTELSETINPDAEIDQRKAA
jgi:ferritin-like metal-binding protein YciE